MQKTSSSSDAAKHPYHHGSLPDALLRAAETVLQRDGLKGLTLRAIAREAGVSHTAPQHHFGDTAGVLSELAASGHLRLAATMATKAAAAGGVERGKAIARGYIEFAVANPDLFRLMSRNELLDPDRPSLVEARRTSARGLAGVFDIAPKEPQTGTRAFGALNAAQAIKMTAAWGQIHGLASLLVDNRLSALAAATGSFRDARELVDAVIDQL
ncbi:MULTISPECIES: TetR/AcrR family transcriptional regulator [unclassified Caballeronia]|uniref:TetR/AcrR family transcriptional regulator n=1 Tax=unclassified Caballeronia TaxID=2646786 RepID=UPI0028626588|nr:MULTISPECIES: TetR/AcrR family transcriptional regulator [unclassified Caballeronia]MDR5752787.1 TetR/AcrR family transcriptional regulator [Caballeronia sp. LZ024]MDR5841429.1 TetR/AcrR family transcriptional regulator [Caballeronia sp. LZ031]